jgi:type VI secretion system secreted protein Hcp
LNRVVEAHRMERRPTTAEIGPAPCSIRKAEGNSARRSRARSWPPCSPSAPSPQRQRRSTSFSIDTIPGESTDTEHKDWILIARFEHGIERTLTASAGVPGRAVCGPLVVTKTIDKATPKLYEACSKGTHLPSATVELVRSSSAPQAYFKIAMQDVLITSVSTRASHSAEQPTEQVAINYSRVEVSYRPQKADGALDTPIQTSFDCPPRAR